MKKIKQKYTNFILTVIAVAMIGILFRGEIIKPAQAAANMYIGEVFTRINENNNIRAKELRHQHNVLAHQIKDQCG